MLHSKDRNRNFVWEMRREHVNGGMRWGTGCTVYILLCGGGHPGAFNERVWERCPNRDAPCGGTLADIHTPFHDSYID